MSKVKIFDFIQLIIFSGKDKVISVYDSKTETSGNIYIKNRKIIDAEINGKKGVDSFYEIVKIKDGYFSEYDLTENRDITINKPTTVLMIKSAEILQEIALEDKEYKKEMNVVIIEENPIDTMILQKYLMDRDFNVITTMFAKDGLEIMRKKKSDYLAIIDINLHGTDSFELMKTIKKEHLAKEVILVSTFSDDSIKNRAYNEGAIAFFNKPIDIKELEAIIAINFGNQGGLSGIAKGISISDFLQLEIASKTNKIINIFDNYTSKEGKLYISDGKVLHAEIDELSGVQAFNKILQLKNGSFIQKEWEDPKVITIDKNIQNLLMDSVKILDENNSELINLSPELLNRLFLMAYSERENFVLTNIIKPKTYISESYKKIEKISFVDIIDPFDFDGLLSLTILDISESETVAVKTKSFISEDDLVKMDLNIIKSIAERFHEGKIKEIVISLDIMTQIIIPIKDSKECFCVVIFDNNQIKEPFDKIKEIILNFTKNVKFLK